jgi:hypothetical protein
LFRSCFIALCCFAISAAVNSVYAQQRTDQLLVDILSKTPDPVFRKVLSHPDTFRLQIIYTVINRDGFNRPRFTNYYFHYDPQQYFNPASTVKLPLAVLALEKLAKINSKAVNKYTTIVFDSSYDGQTAAYYDTTAATGKPSIAQYIRKAFLISDNDAYNRLYQFVGQQTINRSLWNKGYEDVRITRQFMRFTPEQNRHTNAIKFIDRDGSVMMKQEAAYNSDSFYFPSEIKIGKAHYNRQDSLIHEPIDFTGHNNISLETLQQILQSVLFPRSVPARQSFKLSGDDYEFLRRYLSQYPSETSYPKYDSSKYYDSYVKFFFRDSTHKMPEEVRVFNKVGWAYGFLTDVSYVADFNNHVEFMLSATLYVNSDGIVNDNKYDYDSIGYPFLRELGKTVYEYELKRNRQFKPDLSPLRIIYDKRNPADQRASVKEADN